jgi:hypothetical protein
MIFLEGKNHFEYKTGLYKRRINEMKGLHYFSDFPFGCYSDKHIKFFLNVTPSTAMCFSAFSK